MLHCFRLNITLKSLFTRKDIECTKNDALYVHKMFLGAYGLDYRSVISKACFKASAGILYP